MSVKMTTLVTVASTVLIAGCFHEQTENNDNTSNPAGVNIILSGAEVGGATEDLAQLRKPITFSVTTPNPNFQFGQAYGARISSTTEGFYWIVPVSNVSGIESFCFISINDGVIRDAGGNQLDTDALAFVNGSVRKFNASSIYTDTCLGPGESGHMLGIALDIYSQANALVFSNMSVTSAGFGPSDVSMEPLSYTVNTQVNLEYRNHGNTPGEIEPLSPYFPLHTDNTPLIWGFFSPPSGADTVIGAGQSATLVDNLYYTGSSSKITVYLNYQAPVNSASLAKIDKYNSQARNSFSSAEESTEYLSQRRTELINRQRALALSADR